MLRFWIVSRHVQKAFRGTLADYGFEPSDADILLDILRMYHRNNRDASPAQLIEFASELAKRFYPGSSMGCEL